MRVGTNQFRTFEAAVSYYEAYGFSREDVARKRMAGEIICGGRCPQVKAGERVLIDSDGRYHIETAA
jgi:hypothetical protein